MKEDADNVFLLGPQLLWVNMSFAALPVSACEAKDLVACDIATCHLASELAPWPATSWTFQSCHLVHLKHRRCAFQWSKEAGWVR